MIIIWLLWLYDLYITAIEGTKFKLILFTNIAEKIVAFNNVKFQKD